MKFRKGCGAQNTGAQDIFMTDKTATKMGDSVRGFSSPARRTIRAGEGMAEGVGSAEPRAPMPSAGRQAQLLQQAVELVERAELDRHLALLAALGPLLDADIDRRGEGI